MNRSGDLNEIVSILIEIHMEERGDRFTRKSVFPQKTSPSVGASPVLAAHFSEDLFSRFSFLKALSLLPVSPHIKSKSSKNNRTCSQYQRPEN